ncbi:MAG TPA: hypothetical protein VFC37_13345, partial [Terracidiphilus sp.]|nr:hypothetical protein [Terracidiphilus sp.]
MSNAACAAPNKPERCSGKFGSVRPSARATAEPDRDLLRSGMADILDDDDQPEQSIRSSDVGVDPT